MNLVEHRKHWCFCRNAADLAPQPEAEAASKLQFYITEKLLSLQGESKGTQNEGPIMAKR